MMASSLIFLLVGLFLFLLGIALIVAGAVLFAKRMKVVGAIVALLGLGSIATPVLALLYFMIAFRSMG